MRVLRISTAVLLASTAMFGGSAFAQAAAPAGAGAAAKPPQSQEASVTLEDVVVTAQKRSERLSDVPLSITAASAEQLSRQGVTNPAQLEKIVPGFTFTKSAYNAPVYTIRGVGSYDEAIGISPTVSVYVDQVPLPFSRMTQGAALDLERVEVLKGPQGTLFGQNSTGGAVNYIAAKPTEDFRAGADLTVGRFSQADAGGFISGPIANGVTARLALRTEQRGNWQNNYTRSDHLGQRDFTNGRLLVDINPSDRLSFEASVSGWYDKSDTQGKQKIAYSPINPATPFPDSPGFPTFQADLRAYPNAPAHNSRASDWDPGFSLKRDDHFHQLSLRGDYVISDAVTLTSISAYSHLRVRSPSESDGTALPDSAVIIGGFVNSYSQELRLSGQAGDAHVLKWMVGANYEHDHTNDTQFLFLRATNSGLRLPTGIFRWTQVNNLNDQKVDTWAAFASLDYDLTDQLTVQGSIRYTKQDRDFVGCLADSGNGELGAAFGALSALLSRSPTVVPPGGCVTLDPVTNKPTDIETSLNQDNISWRTGLSWKPTSDLMLYANVTKGWKAGSYGTLPAIRPVQAQPVTQESLLAYEAGFKTALLDRTMQITGAVFYYDYTDKQLLGSINLGQPFGTLPALVTVPSSRIRGAEIDATYRPIQGLTLRAAASYVDSTVKGHYVLSDPLPALRPGGFDIGGSSFPNTPMWQTSSDAEYRFDLVPSWGGFVGANLSYRSRTRSFFGGDNNFILPGYALLDLRAGFEREDGNLRVTFWGRNVNDKFYKTFVSRVSDVVYQTTGMPATYGVTLDTKF